MGQTDQALQEAETARNLGYHIGLILSEVFWRQLAEIPNLVGIKIAPFNRYHTLTVLRGLAESGRAEPVALYTGNDDTILIDLLTTYEIAARGRTISIRLVGGLLGHWAYWTRRAVEQHREVQELGVSVPGRLLTLAAQITEANEEIEWESTLVNEDPYGEGWLAKIEASDLGELEDLMRADSDAFAALIAEERAKYEK